MEQGKCFKRRFSPSFSFKTKYSIFLNLFSHLTVLGDVKYAHNQWIK